MFFFYQAVSVVRSQKVTIIQGWARGSFVEAEAEVEAERSRQRRNRCCLCHFDIMHNAHVVVTCSCSVVNDIYQ